MAEENEKTPNGSYIRFSVKDLFLDLKSDIRDLSQKIDGEFNAVKARIDVLERESITTQALKEQNKIQDKKQSDNNARMYKVVGSLVVAVNAIATAVEKLAL